MKSIFCLLFFFILIPLTSFSQNDVNGGFKMTEFDSLLHKTIYWVSIADFQQVELIEFNDGLFVGSLTHLVSKKTRKKKPNKDIFQKIKIPNALVKKLIKELKKADFETISEGCVVGLDGTTTSFTVVNKQINRNYSYWEIETDYVCKDKGVFQERLQARNLLAIINKEFNLSELFNKFLKYLPKGEYSFNWQIVIIG